MRRGLCVWWLILLLIPPSRAAGQAAVLGSAAVSQAGKGDEDKTVRLMLHPAPEPRAALQYQLLPGLLDRKPGNAAVMYNKLAIRLSKGRDDDFWDKVSQWASMPVAELPGGEAQWTLETRGKVLDDIHMAARREHCDWETPIWEREYFSFYLEDAQATRDFARLLALDARFHVAQGEFDKAVHTLQSGYALGRHVAEGPTLVNGMIGIAISSMMTRQVQEFVQQPGAPNLYWALTALPRPLIDMQRGIEGEMNAVHLAFRDLPEADHGTRSTEYWQQAVDRMLAKVFQWGDSPPMGESATKVGFGMIGYTKAKRGLIERGLLPQEVEAMPVPQVITLYSLRIYEETRDQTFKWFYVPYWEARKGLEKVESREHWQELREREVIPLASMLLPAITAVQAAIARNDRQIAALRTIEALRMYAATHGGRLPRELGEVTEVPIPVDPVTGEPFSYQLRGETAVLEGPPLPGAPLRFEIKLVRP